MRFVRNLLKFAQQLQLLYENPNPIRPLTQKEKENFESATTCHISNKFFTEKDVKCHDYNHFTGDYRSCAHGSCNVFYSDLRVIPCILHHLSTYLHDAHFSIRALADVKGKITMIPLTNEKYVSFTKYLDKSKISFRFIDLFRFLPSYLDKIASTVRNHYILDEVLGEKYSPHTISLLKRKGVFSYDYISSLDKLAETQLPSKECFYN